MANKKNLYPKIEKSVIIGQVTIGDKGGVKFKKPGPDFSPNEMKMLAHWYKHGIKIKLTFQQIEGELFNGDETDETHPMEVKPAEPKLEPEPKPEPEKKQTKAAKKKESRTDKK